jgi:hypothetical protein
VIPDMSKDIDESDLLPLLWHAPGSDNQPAGGD